jgi:hypothetical protein
LLHQAAATNVAATATARIRKLRIGVPLWMLRTDPDVTLKPFALGDCQARETSPEPL